MEKGNEEAEMRDACPNGGHLERPKAAIVSPSSQAKPSQAKPSQAKPSRAESSQLVPNKRDRAHPGGREEEEEEGAVEERIGRVSTYEYLHEFFWPAERGMDEGNGVKNGKDTGTKQVNKVANHEPLSGFSCVLLLPGRACGGVPSVAVKIVQTNDAVATKVKSHTAFGIDVRNKFCNKQTGEFFLVHPD
ncbi:hypothetical protein WN51_12895 [Melipona quadrifasciata]|uniref:Uncharacterized protein n=1 Tax=Melipona quadrifasciata TaxID=166423 RepID=A0A0N0BGR8_9HYME|nr:hypothetical protein WN51_12895 [Melipona quadrifasciata]